MLPATTTETALKLSAVDREVAHALTRASGVVSAAAALLGIRTSDLREYLKASEALRPLLEEQKEARVDRAEIVLEQHLSRGSLRAATMVLATLGRDRGYSNTVHVTGEQVHRHMHLHDLISRARDKPQTQRRAAHDNYLKDHS